MSACLALKGAAESGCTPVLSCPIALLCLGCGEEHGCGAKGRSWHQEERGRRWQGSDVRDRQET